jgi:hypothetical protein
LYLTYSLLLRAQKKKGAIVVLIVVFGPNRETLERFREFALSVIVGIQTGVKGRTGEAAMYDTCKDRRHQPIAWEIVGVEVRCPLCLALDELEARPVKDPDAELDAAVEKECAIRFKSSQEEVTKIIDTLNKLRGAFEDLQNSLKGT